MTAAVRVLILEDSVEDAAARLLPDGAAACVPKDGLDGPVPAIRAALGGAR